ITKTIGQPLHQHVLPADVHTVEILDSERSPALTVRMSAEQLLRDLGLQDEPIPLAPNGQRRWPAGLVADTTGTGRYAAAAAVPGQTYRAIGIDAKDHEPVSLSAISSITRHQERLHLRDLSSAHPGIYWTQVLASAKDNALGVQFGLNEAALGYDEIEVVLSPHPAHPDSGSFDVHPVTKQQDASPPPLFSGRFRVGGGTVLTAITIRRTSNGPGLTRDSGSRTKHIHSGAPLAASTTVPEPGRIAEKPVDTEIVTEPVAPEPTAPVRPHVSTATSGEHPSQADESRTPATPQPVPDPADTTTTQDAPAAGIDLSFPAEQRGLIRTDVEDAETPSQPEPGRPEAARPPPGIVELAPGLVVEVVRNEELTGTFASYASADGGWSGADSTYSRRLPDGRHLWMFSDTFLGTADPDGSRHLPAKMVNTAFVVDNDGELSTIHRGTTDSPRPLIQAEKRQFYWLGGSSVTDNTVQVMFIRFLRKGRGGMNIRFADNLLARFDAGDLSLIDTTPMPSAAGVAWSAWLDYDGTHTYVYGTEDLGT
ncbi:hypothetical protein, partial [Nocardia sp. NPDC019302]|uniref:hypothetical protein n=1 Tax=Nocardia sp. NPDC019302 TaxID=3154592 RepID=UPI0034073970